MYFLTTQKRLLSIYCVFLLPLSLFCYFVVEYLTLFYHAVSKCDDYGRETNLLGIYYSLSQMLFLLLSFLLCAASGLNLV